SSAMVDAYAVVIPAWNAADTIVEAITSLLSQDVPPTEVFVVDDGSTDDTARVVATCQDTRVHLLRQSSRGPGAATNHGLTRVTAPNVAFLDADDVWLPGKAALQLQYLSDHPEVSGVCAWGRTFRGAAAHPE